MSSESFREHPIQWTDQQVSRLWDYYSRTPPYSEIYFSKRFGDQLLKRSGLPLDEDLRVLDFGCGPGFIWDHLQALNARCEYTGIDFSPDSIRKLSEKASGQSRFGGAHVITGLTTPFPDATFDGVLLFEVVEHLKDEYLNATLREISRVLKQSGVLVISTPNDEDLRASTRFCPECGAIFHDWQHVRKWTVESLRERLKSYGFEIRAAQTLDFSAQGARGQVMRFARRLIGRKVNPHMIASFQKK